METKLYIQDSNKPSQILYDSIISCCTNAIKGAGAFAFVTGAGLELLFESPEFQMLIDNGHFVLIIGMDAITNTASLITLRKHRSLHLNFKVLAYISEKSNSIFHSKLIWFSGQSESRLIVGSGNLTLAGLRFNNEAYSESSCTNTEFSSISDTWDRWINENKQFLHEIDEEVVIQKAKENDVIRIRLKRAGIKVEEQSDRKIKPKKEISQGEKEKEILSTEVNIISEWVFDESAKILLAEIPRSGNRWKQVNFNKETFINFFEANTATSSRYIILRSISKDGKLGDVERRPNVSVASQNYRFELGAATGPYPKNGRPIVAVAKLGNATFLYELITPADKDYKNVLSFMNSTSKPNKGKMRRLIFVASNVKSQLPDLALMKQID